MHLPCPISIAPQAPLRLAATARSGSASPACRGHRSPRWRTRLAQAAAAAVLAASGAAQAVDFELVALSGHTPLPYSSGDTTSYLFGLRQPTIADDGWVGFAPGGQGNGISAFMIGVPGRVEHVATGATTVDGTLLATLRSLRVASGQRVSWSASPAGSIVLHYGSDDLSQAPSTRVAASGLVYNRSSPGGPMSFELLADGTQLLRAATSNGTTYEASRLDSAGAYSALVLSNNAASRALPTQAVPGVANAAAGRTFASAAVVGGNSTGLSFVYGLQSGNALNVDGAQVRGNLVEALADGSRRSIVHPGSAVPGVALPSQGINAGLAQFASSGSTVAFRNDFGRNTTFDRKLTGAILRFDAAANPAASTLQVVALPGATVPGLVSGAGTAVTFGHKILPDGSGSLSPLSMLPDNLVEDAARGLAVNADGTVAFVSPVTAAPAAAGYGVFLSRSDGSFSTLATSATITAGTAPGGVGTFAKFHDVAINDNGLAVFSATLTGSDSRQGYWYGHSADELALLVVEGQTLEVLPGVFKTVGNLSTSLHPLDDLVITPLDDGLGNSGHFAFSVIFTDGTEAVLRTPLASAVPEPQAAALWLAGLGLLGWLQRRRLQG